MLNYKIQILPLNILRGSDDNVIDISEQIQSFLYLLFNKMYPKWQDPNIAEFITLMRKTQRKLKCYIYLINYFLKFKNENL